MNECINRVVSALLFFMLLLFSFSVAHSAKIEGYYEYSFRLDGYRQNDPTTLQSSKVRLDLLQDIVDNAIQFTGNINFIRYHSSVVLNIRPYLPAEIADTLEAIGFDAIHFPQERYYLDNAFLTMEGDAYRFRLGKQQLSWGAGYFMNPTDLFHRKDPFDPTYEKEGVTAARFDYYWGIGGQITGIIVPDRKLRYSGLALRAATHIEKIGYDIALTVHSVTDSLRFQNLSTSDSILFGQLQQHRYAYGLELSGSLFGLGAWMEGNYNQMEKSEDFLRFISGIDYTFENGFYLISEFLFDDRSAAKAPYPATIWLENLFSGEPIGRYLLMLGMRKDITDLTDFSMYAFTCFDGGLAINPRIDYSLAQNADLTIFGTVLFGKSTSAFQEGVYLVNTRCTVYF